MNKITALVLKLSLSWKSYYKNKYVFNYSSSIEDNFISEVDLQATYLIAKKKKDYIQWENTGF